MHSKVKKNSLLGILSLSFKKRNSSHHYVMIKKHSKDSVSSPWCSIKTPIQMSTRLKQCVISQHQKKNSRWRKMSPFQLLMYWTTFLVLSSTNLPSKRCLSSNYLIITRHQAARTRVIIYQQRICNLLTLNSKNWMRWSLRVYK